MKKIIPSLIAGAMLASPFGFALGIFVYPFWFLSDVAAEQVTDRESKIVAASGRFIHVDPLDPVHWGRGGTKILSGPEHAERVVHLEQDFEVGPGPRFHVYLVSSADVRSNDDFLKSETVDLGRLRAFKGSQVYPIARQVDLRRFLSVVIWCKEFGVLISPASLSGA